jgi:hypothetical protein
MGKRRIECIRANGGECIDYQRYRVQSEGDIVQHCERIWDLRRCNDVRASETEKVTDIILSRDLVEWLAWSGLVAGSRCPVHQSVTPHRSHRGRVLIDDTRSDDEAQIINTKS